MAPRINDTRQSNKLGQRSQEDDSPRNLKNQAFASRNVGYIHHKTTVLRAWSDLDPGDGRWGKAGGDSKRVLASESLCHTVRCQASGSPSHLRGPRTAWPGITRLASPASENLNNDVGSDGGARTADGRTHFGPVGLEFAWTANRRHGAAIAPKIPSQREQQSEICSIAAACPRWSSYSHSR